MIQAPNLLDEFGLSAIAGMTDVNDLGRSRATHGRSRGVVSDCDEALGLQHEYEGREEFFTCLPFAARVCPIAEWVICHVRMKREYIPKKNWLIHLGQHCPNDGGCSFRYRGSGRCSLDTDVPSHRMRRK